MSSLDLNQVLPSLASLPSLLQQISDRDLLLQQILTNAATMDSIHFYCWLQEEFVPEARKVIRKEDARS